MKCVVLTWIGENRDIPRNLPAGMPVHPARKADTSPPDDKPVPANARHIVPCTSVEAVAAASEDVRHIVAEEEPGAAPVFEEVAVAATSSAVADSAARFEVVRPSVSAFADVVDTEVSVAAVAVPVAAEVALVPAVEWQVLPSGQRDYPRSSPFSVPKPSRQSSSGLALLRKGVPVRVR